jgi:ubiquinone/menaquinone biosynthesis C-methylase UbiE
MEEWLETKGELVLREIGIKEGMRVLDFGSGAGVYTIISSKIVGIKGEVCALDINEDSLKELSNEIKSSEIKNIKIIKTSKEIAVPFEDEYFDFFLLYDVFHLLDSNNRNKILREAYRVLKKDGILSYHATHIGSYDINLKQVQKKMNAHGFILKEEFRKSMFHWRWIEKGLVFNYGKDNFKQ